MNHVRFPSDLRLERLRREHPRKKFCCGVAEVEHWLSAKALQHQDKHLSATKVLVDDAGTIAGYYTLATGQVDFSDLPAEAAKRLPRRSLPVAVLAWLGVSSDRQGQGLGRLLFAQALRDCWEAGKTFAFVAVIIDCINDDAKAFYQQWDFAEVPGRPYRLFLSAKQLAMMMDKEAGAS
ncbi:MAG: GNAT family N-acetyltransferase [Pirellulaceae bacterium]|nr:GNAT family N-acetyltransferase [Pirellulaceae bacterium]